MEEEKQPEIKDNVDLKLSGLKSVSIPFCFLDESGTLGIGTHPYFTVGLIKCSLPHSLQKRIRYIREKNRFWWELKFKNLNNTKLPVAIEVLDVLFNSRDTQFCSYTIDKRSKYFTKEFHSNPFIAYEQISKQLLKGSLKREEILIVLADNVITPKKNNFEDNVKKDINEEFGRLAIAGVCRLDSKTNDLLQLADLIVGSINYELLIKEGLINKPSKAKSEFVKKLKENLGITDLTKEFRNYAFNVRHHRKDGLIGWLK
jgi:hypothetical protein